MRFERNRGRASGLIAGLTAAALGLTAAMPAFGADKYVLEEVDETPVEFGTGWYIRGDIGVSADRSHRDSEITYLGARNETDVSTTFAFRVGAGYRLAPKLRLDATFDYHSRGDATRSGLIPGGCRGEEQTQTLDPTGSFLVTVTQATTIVDCTTQDVDEYDAQDLMLNAYYDLAPRGRFTPYVGVGIGATRLNYSSRRGDVVCDPLSDQRCADVYYGVAGEYGETVSSNLNTNDGTSYHLAGSLMLGVGYRVSKNVLVDASYQFTKTVESPMWGGSNGYDVVDVDSQRHTLRVGLRYELW